MKESPQNEKIIQRLDVLIGLTLDNLLGEENTSMSAKIHYLRNMGVSAAETAAILNKSPNYVTATISQKKKQGNRKK
jgi:phage-related holin